MEATKLLLYNIIIHSVLVYGVQNLDNKKDSKKTNGHC